MVTRACGRESAMMQSADARINDSQNARSPAHVYFSRTGRMRADWYARASFRRRATWTIQRTSSTPGTRSSQRYSGSPNVSVLKSIPVTISVLALALPWRGFPCHALILTLLRLERDVDLEVAHRAVNRRRRSGGAVGPFEHHVRGPGLPLALVDFVTQPDEQFEVERGVFTARGVS